MTDNIIHQIEKACLSAERYGLETYINTECSVYNSETGMIFIKPRGSVSILSKPLDIRLNGSFSPRPCSQSEADTQLHTEIYKLFPSVSSVVHSLSEWVSLIAKTGRSLSPEKYGYIQNFKYTVPCTNTVNADISDPDYPESASREIKRAYFEQGFSYPETPIFFLKGNGAFILGDDPIGAAEVSLSLEYACKKAFYFSKFT